MKFSQRLYCVLLVFVLLFPAFSLSVSADEIKDYTITINTTLSTQISNTRYTLEVIPNDNTEQKATYEVANGIPAGLVNGSVNQTFVIEYNDDSVILSKNRLTTITLHNAYITTMVKNASGTSRDRTLENARVLIFYTDGSKEYIDDVTIDTPESNGLFNFTVEFTPSNDVNRIEFITINDIALKNNTAVSSNTPVTIYAGEHQPLEYSLNFTQQSEEASLLGSVIEWLKGIKNGITDLFSEIKHLPSKIWVFIEDGLFYLFVPDESYMIQFQEDLDYTLENSLGAVYQVTNIMLESWDTISDFDEENYINFPETTINLPDNTEFTFGGYEVKVVPVGLNSYAEAIKSIVGVCCTLTFINGLRKRYDEVMGVEQ